VVVLMAGIDLRSCLCWDWRRAWRLADAGGHTGLGIAAASGRGSRLRIRSMACSCPTRASVVHRHLRQCWDRQRTGLRVHAGKSSTACRPAFRAIGTGMVGADPGSEFSSCWACSHPALIMHRTPFGVGVYAIGGNPYRRAALRHARAAPTSSSSTRERLHGELRGL
jgi:hypothetical protein